MGAGVAQRVAAAVSSAATASGSDSLPSGATARNSARRARNDPASSPEHRPSSLAACVVRLSVSARRCASSARCRRGVDDPAASSSRSRRCCAASRSAMSFAALAPGSMRTLRTPGTSTTTAADAGCVQLCPADSVRARPSTTMSRSVGAVNATVVASACSCASMRCTAATCSSMPVSIVSVSVIASSWVANCASWFSISSMLATRAASRSASRGRHTPPPPHAASKRPLGAVQCGAGLFGRRRSGLGDLPCAGLLQLGLGTLGLQCDQGLGPARTIGDQLPALVSASAEPVLVAVTVAAICRA